MRKFLMSWNKSRLRWEKMLKGERFYFDPSKEGIPATKEGSWQAANDFWRSKLFCPDGPVGKAVGGALAQGRRAATQG